MTITSWPENTSWVRSSSPDQQAGRDSSADWAGDRRSNRASARTPKACVQEAFALRRVAPPQEHRLVERRIGLESPRQNGMLAEQSIELAGHVGTKTRDPAALNGGPFAVRAGQHEHSVREAGRAASRRRSEPPSPRITSGTSRCSSQRPGRERSGPARSIPQAPARVLRGPAGQATRAPRPNLAGCPPCRRSGRRCRPVSSSPRTARQRRRRNRRSGH